MHEKKFSNVHYMFVDKNTDQLLIVFSAFTGKRRNYNYFTKFSKLNINQLYILDTWGVTGSYYWYENGENYPEELVSELIEYIKKKYGIKTVLMAGTSKGGSAALYFGLKHRATAMFSGACQYRVGTYLSRGEHIHILKGMIGSGDVIAWKESLDSKIEKILMKNQGDHGDINLFYSTKELTYQRQIKPLIDDLNSNHIQYNETVNDFPYHDDVGKFFPEYFKQAVRSYIG